MDFRNELIKNGQLNIFGDPIVGNAERTRHAGVELTAEIKINGLEISGNTTISRNRLIKHGEYVGKNPYTGEKYATPQRIDLAGKRIAGFPDYLGSIRVTYRNSGFMFSVLGKYVGDFYTDNFNLESRKVDAYKVFDVTMGYRFGNFEVKVQINNIFNELYAASGVGDEFYPGAERNYFVSFALEF
jgi:iron complex outermembrane receptor protein